MAKTLKVEGMSCEACLALVNMAIEESELNDKVSGIELTTDGGEIELKSDLTSEEMDVLESAVNTAGHYTLVRD